MGDSAVVFDIDGVLCNNQQLLHDFLETNPDEQRWRDEWFAHIDDHPSSPHWVELVRIIRQAGVKVILLTARPTYKHRETVCWLANNYISYDQLWMREEDHSYEDTKRINMAQIMGEFQVILAIDDDPIHVAVFESLGIPTIHAHNGLRAS